MFKFSLTLDEDADIFTITGEHCKWEGKLCRIPRTVIQKQHPSLKKFQQAGVYFLIGEEKGCLKAYVGQAGIRSKDKTFTKRMEEHDKKKDWFKEVFFLTINTDHYKQDLDTAQLDYLELEFYNRVPEGIRTNVNKPQETYMERDRENNLNELIKPVPLLMKVLGRDIFYSSIEKLPDPVPGGGIGKMEYWHLLTSTKEKYIGDAFCRKDEGSGSYIVCKGSKIVPWNVNDDEREKTGKEKDLCDKRKTWATSSTLTLPEDVPFTKKSPAAKFVTGRKSENGNTVWKSATEENYRTFLENTEEPPGCTLPPPPTPNIFHLDKETADKYKVKATFEIPVIRARKSKTIVRENSSIALLEKDIERMRKTKERRQKWFAEHPGQVTLNEKVEFDSPTAAVAFVTGDHMRVPPVMVREEDKKTLAEIIKPLRDAQKQAKGKADGNFIVGNSSLRDAQKQAKGKESLS